MADKTQSFKEEHIRHYKRHNNGKGMNIYILVDPANEKKDESDYTAIWVLGAGEDGNLYVLAVIRDKLSLSERTKLIFELHRTWKPKMVVYEKYGKDADISHIESVMDDKNYHFKIKAVGGSMNKNDRIRRLIPRFENGEIFLPEKYERKNWQSVNEDMVKSFIEEEYLTFPVPEHDDMLDSLSRIDDIDIEYPKPKKTGKSKNTHDYAGHGEHGWMG